MSKETLLKREFRERDVNRLRNIITKKHGNATGIQVGYQKAEKDHTEGDIWEEDSKMWTIKNGIKQSYTKLDAVKKVVRMPFLCPCCNKPMKNSLDKKMYPLHNSCFDCVVTKESQLKMEGKYEDYMKNMIKKNVLTHIEEAEQFIEEFLDTDKQGYVTEQGDIEEWEGGQDKNAVVEKWKEELQEMKKSIEK